MAEFPYSQDGKTVTRKNNKQKSTRGFLSIGSALDLASQLY